MRLALYIRSQNPMETQKLCTDVFPMQVVVLPLSDLTEP